MPHVTALAQHILSLEPDKDPARLALYHFLKNLCDAAEPISSQVLNRFFCRSLTFAHWQAEKTKLFEETAAVLHHYQDSIQQALPLQGTLRPEDLQVVV